MSNPKTDLSGGDAPAAPDLLSYESINSDGRRRMDPWNAIAHTMRGLPAEWHWRTLDSLPGGWVRVVGAVPRPLLRGPHKGKMTWSGCESTTFIATRAEQQHVKKTYEATTGRCHKCAGSGDEVAMVDGAGATYRACQRCGGSGRMEAP